MVGWLLLACLLVYAALVLVAHGLDAALDRSPATGDIAVFVIIATLLFASGCYVGQSIQAKHQSPPLPSAIK